MKVNEVITEGLGNFLKQTFSSQTPAQKLQAQHRVGTTRWVKEWNRQVKANPDLSNNPKALQDYANKISTGADGQQHIQAPLPTDMSPQGVSSYLTSVIGQIQQSVMTQQVAQHPGPTSDIKDTLDTQMQYRFPNPEFPGTQIIVRKSGWYLDKLPPELRGEVNVDKTTRLYPVLQTRRIALYNQYYNQAAELGKIKEEPASML
jgi:hypothetical protein